MTHNAGTTHSTSPVAPSSTWATARARESWQALLCTSSSAVGASRFLKDFRPYRWIWKAFTTIGCRTWHQQSMRRSSAGHPVLHHSSKPCKAICISTHGTRQIWSLLTAHASPYQWWNESTSSHSSASVALGSSPCRRDCRIQSVSARVPTATTFTGNSFWPSSCKCLGVKQPLTYSVRSRSQCSERRVAVLHHHTDIRTNHANRRCCWWGKNHSTPIKEALKKIS